MSRRRAGDAQETRRERAVDVQSICKYEMLTSRSTDVLESLTDKNVLQIPLPSIH
jgi:hypothetical protein